MKERLEKGELRFFTGVAGFFTVGYLFLGPGIHELSHLFVIWPSGCEYTFRRGFNLFTGFRASYELGCAAKPYILGLFYFSGYIGTLLSSLAAFYLSSKSEGWKSSLLSSLGTGMLLSIVSSISLKGDVFNGLKAFGLEGYADLMELLSISVILVITLIEVERHHNSKS